MNEKTKYRIMENRERLKGYNGSDAGAEMTDQQQKLPPIPTVKVYEDAVVIDLPEAVGVFPGKTFECLVQERETHRKYRKEKVTLQELSFLLTMTQRIRKTVGSAEPVTFRPVPSAGSKHPLETYLFLNAVEGLPRGLYHYRPDTHQLEVLDTESEYQEELKEAVCRQKFASTAPVLFVWSAFPYRTEWRYGLKAAKYVLLDAGHVCQNLYLAAENIGLGACAIGAYDQDLIDELLGLAPGPSAERDYECAVYLAAVGRP